MKRLFLIAAALALLASTSALLAQRNNAPAAAADKADAPTVVGKVVAYDADKSITIETPAGRNVEARKTEFVIVKDKTKIELPPRKQAIEVGMTLAVWTDKENPKQAAKIAVPMGNAAGNRGRANPDAPKPPAR
jgi:hypothetical protein